MRVPRLLAMARKEALQLRRDPRSLSLAFVLPILLILFFGFAIRWDVEDIEMVVLDQSRTRRSHDLVQAFRSSGYFIITEYAPDYEEVESRLRSGEALVALVIPADFARELTGPDGASVQVLLDGTDAFTADIARSYVESIISAFAAATRSEVETEPTIRAESRVWYNETLESKNMVVPGLIAVIMSIIAAMLTALTIAREWERGTMEQLAATPVGRSEVILGKLIPYLFIGLFDVALAVVLGLVIFDVPFRGSVLILAVLTFFFLVGSLGLGIFISAAFKSQVVATQVAVIVTFLPAVLLSGFLFAIGNMPRALQLLTYAIPARYYVAITRGVFLKGVGPYILWQQGVPMLLYAVVGLGSAMWVFRKEIG